jgi:hypothetical protein
VKMSAKDPGKPYERSYPVGEWVSTVTYAVSIAFHMTPLKERRLLAILSG